MDATLAAQSTIHGTPPNKTGSAKRRSIYGSFLDCWVPCELASPAPPISLSSPASSGAASGDHPPRSFGRMAQSHLGFPHWGGRGGEGVGDLGWLCTSAKLCGNVSFQLHRFVFCSLILRVLSPILVVVGEGGGVQRTFPSLARVPGVGKCHFPRGSRGNGSKPRTSLCQVPCR